MSLSKPSGQTKESEANTLEAARNLVRQFIDDEAKVANDDEVAKELEVEGDQEPELRLTVSTHNRRSKGRPASHVWQYFKRVDSSKDAAAICLLCLRDGINVEKKRPGSSTRDMWKHLSGFHNIDKFGKVSIANKQSQNVVPYQPYSDEQRALNWKIARWMVIDKRPFACADSEVFKDMLVQANPRYRIPSRMTFRRLACKILAHTQQAVRERLQELWCHFPSYTADMWSAMDTTQYISLQLHVYDDEWQYKMISTGAVCLPPPHDKYRIATEIDNLLLNMGFSGQYKISGTTDSGANIFSAIENILAHDWLPCINHLLHLAVTEVLALPQIAEVIALAHNLCVMFRKSGAKWEQLRVIQVNLIQNRKQDEKMQVEVEDEEDVDDLAESHIESHNAAPNIALRPKINQATRWNSVASMMMRLIVLRVPIESWFVQNKDDLKADDPQQLTEQQWETIMDVTDILGQLLPLTKALEAGANPGVVHVLPTLLHLLTRLLQKPADSAKHYSGRSKDSIAKSLGLRTDVLSEYCVSPLQRTIVDQLIAAFFGEKGQNGRRTAGRCNSFAILYAWSITAGMDPRNLHRWESRLEAPLSWLVSNGYALTAYKETKQAYKQDILQLEEDECEQNEPAEDQPMPVIPQTQTITQPVEADVATPVQQRGKRKRVSNRRYLSSPIEQGTQQVPRKRAGRPKKGRITEEVSFGAMLKALVLDEIEQMARQCSTIQAAMQADRQEENRPSTHGSENPKKKSSPTRIKLGLYSSDEEEEVVPDAGSTDQVAKELAAYQLEANEKRLDVLEWWKQNAIRYPCLARVAHRNLAVQATSSQSERDFSVAGQVVNKKRVALTPEAVNICTFCSINKEFVPEDEP